MYLNLTVNNGKKNQEFRKVSSLPPMEGPMVSRFEASVYRAGRPALLRTVKIVERKGDQRDMCQSSLSIK